MANKLDKLLIMQSDYVEERKQMRVEFDEIPSKIENVKRKIDNCKKDILAVQNDKTDYKLISPEEQRAMRKMIYQSLQTWENHPVEKYITKGKNV